MNDRPIQIGTDRQLFVDDYLIDQLEGARLRLHEPVRREWALTADHPWEQHLTVDGQQFRDGDRYRMFYSCSAGDPDAGAGNPRMAALAESEDGIRWHKPSVGLIDHRGSTDNNLVWRGPGNGLAVFRDCNPEAAEDARYKAIARHGRPMDSLLALASPDGVHWRQFSESPIFLDDGPFDSHNIAFWDTWRSEYVAYARSSGGADGKGSFQGGVRWIRRSTSRDFVHWTPWEPVVTRDRPWEHLYTNACVQYERAPGIYLMFPSRFVPDRTPNADWPEPGISDIVLMSSRDGLNFERTFMEAFIRPGLDADNWHERSLYINRGILQTSPTELSLYGREHSSLPSVHYTRFTLRPDGFVSVNAGYDGGELVTKPLLFAGRRLELNFATSAVGSIRAEIQSAEGEPIPGYGLGDCPEHFGDEIDRTVRWSGDASLDSLAGVTVRIRFAIRDADLFAIKFNE